MASNVRFGGGLSDVGGFAIVKPQVTKAVLVGLIDLARMNRTFEAVFLAGVAAVLGLLEAIWVRDGNPYCASALDDTISQLLA